MFASLAAESLPGVRAATGPSRRRSPRRRLVDGAQIATFTTRLREVVERPWQVWGEPPPLRAVSPLAADPASAA